jgi:serine/threonine-protein kinase
MSLPTSVPSPESEPSDRLDSWKEIAAYFSRGVTTVQRWEREESLPVYRHQHDALGSVYAFKHELEAWRLKRTLHQPRNDGNDDTLQPVASEQHRRPGWAWWQLAMITATVLLGAAGAFALRAPKAVVRRVTIVPPATAPLVVNGNGRDLAITPDGTHIVYVGGANGSRLYVRALDQYDVTSIGGVGSPGHPFISPDGQWIGFFDGGTSLKKVPLAGGAAVEIAAIGPSGPQPTAANDQYTLVRGNGGATWGPNNLITFATMGSLWQVAADGGAPRLLKAPDGAKGETAYCWPEYVPKGNVLLFTIIPAGDWSDKGSKGLLENAQIAALDLRTGTQKVLVEGGSDAHYVESGHLVFTSAEALKAVPFNVSRLEVTGSPVTVASQIRVSTRGAADFDVAQDGTLAYATGNVLNDLVRLTWVDRTGHEEDAGLPPFVYRYPRLSPNGRRMVVGSFRDLGIWDFASKSMEWLGVGPTTYPVWTPDGGRLIFSSTRGGSAKLYSFTIDGSQHVNRLVASPQSQSPNAISPNGRYLVYREDTASADLMLLDLLAGGSAQPLIRTPFRELNADFSPDGKFLTFQSNSSGQDEVYVEPFPNTDSQRWMISRGGGTRPAWARGGKEIFYLSVTGAMMSVPITEHGGTIAAGDPVTLFEGSYYLGSGSVAGRTYDAAADGTRFLMMKPVNASPPSTSAGGDIEVILNWLDELKRTVRAD